MSKTRKILAALVVGALASCGIATNSAADPAVGAYRMSYDGKYTVFFFAEEGRNCGPWGGHKAVRKHSEWRFNEEGCWTLNDMGNALDVWWPSGESHSVYPSQIRKPQ